MDSKPVGVLAPPGKRLGRIARLGIETSAVRHLYICWLTLLFKFDIVSISNGETNMITINFYNFGYSTQAKDLADAKQKALNACFSCTATDRDGKILFSYCPISGFKYY